MTRSSLIGLAWALKLTEISTKFHYQMLPLLKSLQIQERLIGGKVSEVKCNETEEVEYKSMSVTNCTKRV